MSYSMIDMVWARLQGEMDAVQLSDEGRLKLKSAFAGGLYAAAASVSADRFDAQSISEAAYRIEYGR